MVDTTMDALAWVRKQVEQADTDLLREMVKLFCERGMGEEADAICGAPYGERSEERTNRRNGYRARRSAVVQDVRSGRELGIDGIARESDAGKDVVAPGR